MGDAAMNHLPSAISHDGGMYNPDATHPFTEDFADVDFRHEIDRAAEG
jgi:hypothetical protein